MTIMIDKAHYALFFAHSLLGPVHLSQGQRAMNALVLYRPDLVRNLPVELDPVLDANNYDAFMHWVAQNW